MGNKPVLRTMQVSCPVAPAQAQGASMVMKRQCRHFRIKDGSQEASFFELVGGERSGFGVNCPRINNLTTSPSPCLSP